MLCDKAYTVKRCTNESTEQNTFNTRHHCFVSYFQPQKPWQRSISQLFEPKPCSLCLPNQLFFCLNETLFCSNGISGISLEKGWCRIRKQIWIKEIMFHFADLLAIENIYTYLWALLVVMASVFNIIVHLFNVYSWPQFLKCLICLRHAYSLVTWLVPFWVPTQLGIQEVLVL